MKTLSKKIILLLTIFVCLSFLPACQSYGPPVGGIVNGIDIKLSVKPTKPVAGENHFKVSLKNQSDPLTNVNVTVRYFMPAMGTMPAMQGSNTATASSTKGEYETDLNLPMDGDWSITIMVQAADKPLLNANFHLRTGSEFINFEGE